MVRLVAARLAVRERPPGPRTRKALVLSLVACFVSLAAIVNLIASTHSRSGLRVRSELDRRRYPDGVTVTDAQMATVRLTRHKFHGEWNYSITP